ncbi:bifunctional 5,10-methylene-tetrahydrofolate dehydrogenase/5,10-methylene-tetrahydrofolate cyclohydrolase [Candidatus Bipolaricaulota bacterium]|nr:bifunctional 5,10-methylene-tetrahydrofolate dehydrogenase/5,10-methylene-tetrahydrofolate cyclohydrolase [Candidatus Bipolaricaulota bacterium]
METKVLSGKEIAASVHRELGERVARLRKKGTAPRLVLLRVGDDPASISYVRQKERAARELGVEAETRVFPIQTSEARLCAEIRDLNAAPSVHGILVQLPLPSHIDEKRVLATVHPRKDVDGLHPENLGRLLRGDPYLVPCTPHAVQELLVRSGHAPEGKHVVICGRSVLNGRSLFAVLIQKAARANATITVCHTGTPDLAHFTRQADILVAAMGTPRAITADMVREGAVVIDVGVNRVPDPNTKSGYRLVGDTDFAALLGVAAAITPVPGGVGPMTVAMLLWNTITACEVQTAG